MIKYNYKWSTALGFAVVLGCTVPMFLNGCAEEACSKTMTVTGTVTDNSSTPLSGVDVFCCTVGELTTAKTTTGSDGKYSFTVGNLGGFAGAKVHYAKSGYTAQDATEFTDAEAGISRCDSYTIERNVSLSP